MSWQEIMEQVLEINELQQEIEVKLNNPVIKEITNRNQKYCKDLKLDLRSLNNAILEHKITITPYQITIIERINELKLDISSQSLYINMPEQKEKAEEYVVTLKKQYELVNNCLELIINTELLSELEYETSGKFENSEYAKKVNNENELFQKLRTNLLNLTPEIYGDIIIKFQKEYMNRLSDNQKKELLIETLTLSYEKNAFDFFNKELLIEKIRKDNNYNMEQLYLVRTMYQKYKNSLIITERLILSDMSIQQIYDEFKIIYETEFFKQKIMKK